MKVYLEQGATLPTRAHETDAGLDLYSRESQIIPPQGSAVFDTGVHIDLPNGTFGKLESKSGLNVKHGIVSCGGVIDEGYTGSIKVKLYNLGDKDVAIRCGEKLIQLVVQPCLYETVEVSSFDEWQEIRTDRGNAGFGSTGRFPRPDNEDASTESKQCDPTDEAINDLYEVADVLEIYDKHNPLRDRIVKCAKVFSFKQQIYSDTKCAIREKIEIISKLEENMKRIIAERDKLRLQIEQVRSTGEWIKLQYEPIAGVIYYKCSACGKIIRIHGYHQNLERSSITEFPFCNCGAKMRMPEEEKNE